MVFLKAYGVKFDLATDTISLKAGTLINSLYDDGPERFPVRILLPCTLLTGHLNRCHAQVEDTVLQGRFLFESATHSWDDTRCQFEVQVVNVRDGLTDLYVEYQGMGPALKLPCGQVLGVLRQLAATKVHTHTGRESGLCLALYSIGAPAVATT